MSASRPAVTTGPGRHRRGRTGQVSRDRSGPARLFPSLFGPSRRAAWRRFCLRRALAGLLLLAGSGLIFAAGAATGTAS